MEYEKTAILMALRILKNLKARFFMQNKNSTGMVKFQLPVLIMALIFFLGVLFGCSRRNPDSPGGSKPVDEPASTERHVGPPPGNLPAGPLRDISGLPAQYREVIELQRKGSYDESANALLQAVKANPKYMEKFAEYLDSQDPIFYSRLWNQLFNQEQFDAAGVIVEKAFKSCQPSADLYYRRGRILERKKEWKKAMADYSKAVEMDSGLGMALRARGDIYANIYSEEQKAVDDFTKAIELEKDPEELRNIYFNRGLAYQGIDRKKAREDVKKAFEMGVKPGVDHDYGQTGYGYIIVGDFDRAEECFKKALKEYPDSACPPLGLAKLYSMTGEFDKANKYVEIGIKIDQGHQKSEKEHCEEILGDIEKIKKHILAPIKDLPAESLKKAVAAFTFIHQNDYDRAEKLIEELQEKYPNNNGMKVVLAGLYYRMGEEGMAEKLLKNVPNPPSRESLTVDIYGN